MYRNVQRLMDDLDQDLFVRQLPAWKAERKLRESRRPQAEVIRFSSPAPSGPYEEGERWEEEGERWEEEGEMEVAPMVQRVVLASLFVGLAIFLLALGT